MVPLMPRARLRGAYLLLLAAGLALVAVVGAALRNRPELGVLDELAEAHPARMLTGRLSISVAHRACTVLRPRRGETVPQEGCGDQDRRLARLDDIAEGAESANADSLHASALLAMFDSATSERPLDQAIKRLSRASQLSGRRASLLVDLSAAYLERAERTQSADDLLWGLEHALEALEREPRNPAALFNAALIQQALGLDHRATLAWVAYLRTDSTSDWAKEARERRRRLYHPPAPVPPEPGAPLAHVRAFAIEHPREARMFGMDTVLGRWGKAWAAGDTARAAALLQLAEELGIELRHRGGDASLFDAAGAIRAASDDRAATRVLARAHQTYAAGQALHWRMNIKSGADSFAAVVAMRPPSPVLMRSAEVMSAVRLVYDKKLAEADARYQALLSRIDSERYPALAGRALWNQGAARLRLQHPTEARMSHQEALRLFTRAGEAQYAAAMVAMDGEGAYHQHNLREAYDLHHQGLASLRVYGDSPWLANVLFMLANIAAEDGMLRAAAAVQDENIAVTLRQLERQGPTEALIGRAMIRGTAGHLAEARADLDLAQTQVERLSDRIAKNTLGARVDHARALFSNDGASLAVLDAAVDTLKGTPLWWIPAVFRRADVRLAQGDHAGARHDLTAATDAVQRLSHGLIDAVLRGAVLEQARGRFDQLVMLHLHAGDTIEALQSLERGRVSFRPQFDTATAAVGRPLAPPGQIGVEYALIGDTLLTWTVRDSDVQVTRATVDRADLLRRIGRVIAGLESPRRAASVGPELEWLYDVLIRPVEDRLGPPDTPLVILADGEIAGVPFEALRDSRRRGRYLVEDHSLRFAATLAEARRPAPVARPSAPALLVADPAFDPNENRGLNRLRGARAEVRTLRRMYPGSRVLEGDSATRDALMRHAGAASVIHYAGHAVFDDARPERSALVLAGAHGRLTTGDVSALRLQGVRVVVLAACQTVRAREGRSGGMAGFSGALLAAGAGGVVGSLWKADDELTQPLMIEFHATYRTGLTPAEALRKAQVAMLTSDDSARSNPAAWAGFRYIGT